MPAYAKLDKSATKSVATSFSVKLTLEPPRHLTVVETARRGQWFPPIARGISPAKPYAAVCHLTGEGERSCRNWCSGAVDPPARAIIKLLRSVVGWAVLEHLMRNCKQQWWMDVLEARKVMAGADRRIREINEQFELLLSSKRPSHWE